MASLKKIRVKENLHIVMWLFKDFCWIMDFKPLGMLMILPTLILALHLSWQYRHMRSELFHNLAVTCWIMANSVWMTGEFFFDDTWRPGAMVFFLIGIALIVSFYGSRLIRGEKLLGSDAGLEE